VERFRHRFEALGGVWHVASRAGLADVVATIVRPGATARLDGRSGGSFDPAQLAPALRERGVQVCDAAEADPDRVGAGITTVLAAVAESATLLIAAGPGGARSASVLPPVHIAIVSRGQVVASLADGLERATPLIARGATSAVVLVSGPSRTGDIEGQLVVGVHGPGEIHCVLTD
jgi:L-lactate dehydrogenase complex protein LldG